MPANPTMGQDDSTEKKCDWTIKSYVDIGKEGIDEDKCEGWHYDHIKGVLDLLSQTGRKSVLTGGCLTAINMNAVFRCSRTLSAGALVADLVNLKAHVHHWVHGARNVPTTLAFNVALQLT
jgi:hypothetical protein